mgnify:CR=1 FL=1
MSKLTKSWLDKKEPLFDSSMLKVGEMMETKSGEIILRVYRKLVSLNNPNSTWDLAPNVSGDIYGRKLQPGESITLTQE